MTGSLTELSIHARAVLLSPPLDELWVQSRHRMERNGLRPAGRIRLTGLDEDSRRRLAALLGKPVSKPDVTVALEALDQVLPATIAGCGLRQLLERLHGPLVDRRAVKDADSASRAALLAQLRADLAPLGEPAWLERWEQSLVRSGQLARPQVARPLLGNAASVMVLLPWEQIDAAAAESAQALLPGRLLGRGDLAAQVTGTAHGLDDDTALARLVLRSVAYAAGLAEPASSEQRREMWARIGVLTDTVYTTVLTSGLAPAGDDLDSRHLRERAAAGVETHLSLAMVRRIDWQVPAGTVVHAVENPRVLQAALDERLGVPLICLGGNPTVVGLSLLDRLRSAGAVVRYHGDFDWPGVAITNRLIAGYGVQPWQMNAADYEHAAAHAWLPGTSPLPLEGTPVQASWDPELTATMQRRGAAVHEESCLAELLGDLAARPRAAAAEAGERPSRHLAH